MKWPLLFMRAICVGLCIAISVSCGGGSGGALANGDGISGTGSVALSKVGLAADSYGSGSNLSFELNTLAPILVVEFQETQENDPNDNLRITLTDLQQNQSLTILGGDGSPSNLSFKPSSDGRTFYIHLAKSKSLETLDTELKPGGLYRFTIESLDGSNFLYQDESTAKLTGTLSVKDLTLTYLGEFDKGDSLVRLGNDFRGIGSLNPEFLVHTNIPLPNSESVDSLGPLTLIDIRFGNTSLLKSSSEYFEVLEVQSTAALVRVKDSPFYWGGNYDLDVLPKLNAGNPGNDVTSEQIPARLQLELQDSPE
jgi:hypothetical protein